MAQTYFQKNKKSEGPKVIKKYGNRKLYDTEQSSYVVLKDIEKMIRNEEEIQVIDNETQDDITVPTLTQIIFSSEKKSKVCPPINVLKDIIKKGDGSFSSFLSTLGLFNSTDETKLKNSSLKSSHALSANKKTGKLEDSQNLEQKITNLMNSNGGLSPSNEDSIPKLPGNRFN